MGVRLSFAISLVFFLLGGALMLIPPKIIPYIGIPMLILGVLVGLWASYGWLQLKRLAQLTQKRVHTRFMKADFQAMRMSSPHVDFYFCIHSCLSHPLILTGQKRGELSDAVQVLRANWEIDSNYQSTIMPDLDSEIRIRWTVSQGGYNSPMVEFAFAAEQDPPVQHLTFNDMHIGLKARVLRLESNIGWLQLPQDVIPVPVPNLHIFEIVRHEYQRQKEL